MNVAVIIRFVQQSTLYGLFSFSHGSITYIMNTSIQYSGGLKLIRLIMCLEIVLRRHRTSNIRSDCHIDIISKIIILITWFISDIFLSEGSNTWFWKFYRRTHLKLNLRWDSHVIIGCAVIHILRVGVLHYTRDPFSTEVTLISQRTSCIVQLRGEHRVPSFGPLGHTQRRLILHYLYYPGHLNPHAELRPSIFKVMPNDMIDSNTEHYDYKCFVSPWNLSSAKILTSTILTFIPFDMLLRW